MTRTITTLLLGSLVTPSVLAQGWTETVLSPAGGFRAHASRDFDNDGLLDVLVAAKGGATSVTNSLFLYRGEGGGAFGRGLPVAEDLPRVDDMVACDVDGDGDEDVLTYRRLSGEVGLHLGDGTGGFDARAVLATLGGASGQRRLPLRCVDGDGDGDLDVYFAVLEGTPNEGVWWLEQLSPGSFAPAVALLAPGEAVATFDVGDLDGDGDTDVVAAPLAQGGYAWYRNDGAGTLAGPLVIESGASFGIPQDVRAVDVIGDGRLDVVGSFGPDRRMAVYFRNLGSGAFTSRIDIGTLQRGIRSISLGPLDGAGLSDLVFEEDERRVEAVVVGFGGLLSAPFTVLGGLDQSSDVDLGDVDGDGRLDVVICGRFQGVAALESVRYSRNLGPGAGNPQFAASRPIELFGFDPEAVQAADVTGDGATDVVVGSLDVNPLIYYDNSGDTSFPRVVEIPNTLAGVLALELADVDGDGDTDVLVCEAQTFTPRLCLYENQGDGSEWVERVLATQIGYQGETRTLDFDGDGDTDLLLPVGGNSQPGLGLVENLGQGQFAPLQLIGDLGPIVFPFHLELGDLDGDGMLDAVISGVDQPQGWLVWLKGGQGAPFGPAFVIDTAPTGFVGVENGFTDFVLHDFDGDGSADIACTVQLASVQELRYYAGTAGSPAAPLALESLAPPRSIDAVEALDADGDGDLDLAIAFGPASLLGTSLATFENLGGGSFGARSPIPSATRINSVASLGDVDLDGDTDILTTGSFFSGHVSWYANDLYGSLGPTYCVDAVPNSTGAVGRIAALGAPAATENVARLRAWALPLNSFGYFLASRTQDVTTAVPNSVGTLCLGGSIGRFVGPGQVQDSGTTGSWTLQLDLLALPTPLGSVAAAAGETWYFQGWGRDSLQGIPTSNFTDAVSVVWQ